MSPSFQERGQDQTVSKFHELLDTILDQSISMKSTRLFVVYDASFYFPLLITISCPLFCLANADY